MSRTPKRAFPHHSSQERASLFFGALSSLMKKYSRHSDVTGVECNVHANGEITHVLVCAYSNKPGNDIPLPTWYAGLAAHLKANEELLPVTDIMFYVGYNYHKPGLIWIKNGKVGYSKSRDFLDHPRLASCFLHDAVGLDRFFSLSKKGADLLDKAVDERSAKANAARDAWDHFWQSMSEHGINGVSRDEGISRDEQEPGFAKLELAIEEFQKSNPTPEQVLLFEKAILAFGEYFS